jgi:phosphopantothenoylcysteine decarboxylase/phosphopantothenate--cysteine ligase
MLITAGPTHEPIDAVRYIANRSSGRLGLALAEAARDAGWEVTLLLGPVVDPPPQGVRTLRFETAEDLGNLLDEHFDVCDVLIMAAAVADYRVPRVLDGKLPRGDERRALELEPTPDLVAGCARRKRPGQRVIGFALEDADQLATHGAEKLRRKRLDAIVANPLATMGAEVIDATIYTPGAEAIHPPKSGTSEGLTKRAFAEWLIRWIDR